MTNDNVSLNSPYIAFDGSIFRTQEALDEYLKIAMAEYKSYDLDKTQAYTDNDNLNTVLNYLINDDTPVHPYFVTKIISHVYDFMEYKWMQYNTSFPDECYLDVLKKISIRFYNKWVHACKEFDEDPAALIHKACLYEQLYNKS